jgi:drug/metabolite transporter (DMT)-like permease
MAEADEQHGRRPWWPLVLSALVETTGWVLIVWGWIGNQSEVIWWGVALVVAAAVSYFWTGGPLFAKFSRR